MVNTAITRERPRAGHALRRASVVPESRVAVPPSSPRRRLAAGEREQMILAGAVQFFARRGLEAQTRELADELGITHALLYHYFPSKSALIERVYEKVIAGRWDPAWEALLDSKLPAQEKLCRFYDQYLNAILTPEWLRTLVHSGLADGHIPTRYFALLRERLFPRLIRETRRANGCRSRAATTVREEALMVGFHGGLIYQLGMMPLVYGQVLRGQGERAAREQFISDMVQGYLAQAAFAVPKTSAAT
jgi:AcrR family transcriptional regulator